MGYGGQWKENATSGRGTLGTGKKRRMKTKEPKVWEDKVRDKNIPFRGTVQKTAVQCGFREYGVVIADWPDAKMLTAGWSQLFLESFREKPGKSGISITCARLIRVGKGPDG